jgi:2-polyprenyl-3-methyl-5-hydroxy-6-metoxy-1,4-benzoquinol methylase
MTTTTDPTSPTGPASRAIIPNTLQSKYAKTNAITRRLLAGFFGALDEAVSTAGAVSSALEVGCGEGVSTEKIRAMLPPGALLHASDINRVRLAAARERNPGIPIIEESIYSLSRADRSYDLVFCLEVLEHLDDPDAALAEICRVSRRWVVTSVPREPVWRVLNLMRLKYVSGLGNTPGHLNHWSKPGFTDFVGRRLDVRKILSPFPWTMVVGEVKR